MLIPEQREQAIRARADLLTALVLVVLGAVIFYFSFTMDRLEVRRIHPLTIPGLVPMGLSLGLVLCGGLLALRSRRLAAPEGWRALGAVLYSDAARRVWAILALAFFYTLVLVGWLSFWAASALFIFAFIALFELVLAAERRPLLPSLLWALAVALTGGIAVHYVFQQLFLVRLP
jgi:putative tricarboxylic transport membrane protein